MRRRARKLEERRSKAGDRLDRVSWFYFRQGRLWDLFRHIVFRRLSQLSEFLFGHRNAFKRWTDSDPK